MYKKVIIIIILIALICLFRWSHRTEKGKGLKRTKKKKDKKLQELLLLTAGKKVVPLFQTAEPLRFFFLVAAAFFFLYACVCVCFHLVSDCALLHTDSYEVGECWMACRSCLFEGNRSENETFAQSYDF